MKKIYQVCGIGKNEFYDTEEELLQHYQKIGENYNPRQREELQGTPKLFGLLGAMYNGIKNGCAVIRYETQEVYDILSN